ncbi:MAG TPA: hypothetical protein EYQ24_16895 [Bacteroidetes bacterium]|nr:hypothetical protein [Bacteroidota bacterium]HIL56314.1 hypothetical protein [Rhodothermales bacterium]
MRTFSFALVTALALGGCDVFESIESPDPVAIPITAVRIADLPERPNRTTEWDDDGTGPDIFVEVQNTSGASIGRSEIVPDVDVTSPFTIKLPSDLVTRDDAASLYVVAYDDDGNRLTATRLGGSEAFTVRQLAAASDSLLLVDGRSENGRETTYSVLL